MAGEDECRNDDRPMTVGRSTLHGHQEVLVTDGMHRSTDDRWPVDTPWSPRGPRDRRDASTAARSIRKLEPHLNPPARTRGSVRPDGRVDVSVSDGAGDAGADCQKWALLVVEQPFPAPGSPERVPGAGDARCSGGGGGAGGGRGGGGFRPASGGGAPLSRCGRT